MDSDNKQSNSDVPERGGKRTEPASPTGEPHGEQQGTSQPKEEQFGRDSEDASWRPDADGQPDPASADESTDPPLQDGSQSDVERAAGPDPGAKSPRQGPQETDSLDTNIVSVPHTAPQPTQNGGFAGSGNDVSGRAHTSDLPRALEEPRDISFEQSHSNMPYSTFGAQNVAYHLYRGAGPKLDPTFPVSTLPEYQSYEHSDVLLAQARILAEHGLLLITCDEVARSQTQSATYSLLAHLKSQGNRLRTAQPGTVTALIDIADNNYDPGTVVYIQCYHEDTLVDELNQLEYASHVREKLQSQGVQVILLAQHWREGVSGPEGVAHWPLSVSATKLLTEPDGTKFDVTDPVRANVQFLAAALPGLSVADSDLVLRQLIESLDHSPSERTKHDNKQGEPVETEHKINWRLRVDDCRRASGIVVGVTDDPLARANTGGIGYSTLGVQYCDRRHAIELRSVIVKEFPTFFSHSFKTLIHAYFANDKLGAAYRDSCCELLRHLVNHNLIIWNRDFLVELVAPYLNDASQYGKKHLRMKLLTHAVSRTASGETYLAVLNEHLCSEILRLESEWCSYMLLAGEHLTTSFTPEDVERLSEHFDAQLGRILEALQIHADFLLRMRERPTKRDIHTVVRAMAGTNERATLRGLVDSGLPMELCFPVPVVFADLLAEVLTNDITEWAVFAPLIVDRAQDSDLSRLPKSDVELRVDESQHRRAQDAVLALLMACAVAFRRVIDNGLEPPDRGLTEAMQGILTPSSTKPTADLLWSILGQLRTRVEFGKLNVVSDYPLEVARLYERVAMALLFEAGKRTSVLQQQLRLLLSPVRSGLKRQERRRVREYWAAFEAIYRYRAADSTGHSATLMRKRVTAANLLQKAFSPKRAVNSTRPGKES